jgi:hypothetical protein
MPRPLPGPLLPRLSFLLHVDGKRRITQIRMVERGHSPRIEKSGLMSHLLHRMLIANRREQNARYLASLR